MEVLAKQVFSEKQIVTSALVSKGLKCSVDEANKVMYQFYLKNRDNLEAYFIIVRKEGTMKIVIDRLPEQRLNYLLYDQEYSTNILSLKIWAVYDKSRGELDITDIYEVEDADLHAIQNLCYNLRELDLKKAEYQAKNTTTTPSKVSSQTSNKKAQNNVPEKEKAKPTTASQPKESQEYAKKQPDAKENKKTDKDTKMIEESTVKAEPVKNNQKKRKGDLFDSFSGPPAQAKELKKAKITNRSDSIEEEKQSKPTKTVILDEEEESYYPDDTPGVRTQSSKLQRSDSIESPVQNKTLKSQNSINKKEEIIERPSPKVNSETNKPKQSPPEELEIEPTEEVTRVKKIRKVPREKTYMDEKGYLIVENELVDEEYWETVKTKPSNHANTQSSNSQAAASKKKAPEKNQATLASFFRKK